MTIGIEIDSTKLDQIFAPYDRSDAPGVVVGVALGGRPRYRRGFGLASMDLPIVLSPTMRLRIGSTSKHFCCLVILLLAEEGRLSLDDSPRKHLPELPRWADGMTLRQLMSHTSGMRCSIDLILQFSGLSAPAPEGAQLELLSKQDSVNFAPGESWNYNNGGYVLLTEIAERLSGKPLGEVLRERVFEPAGMHDTMLRLYDTDFVTNSASLHLPTLTGGFVRGVFGPPIAGEGGIVSTVDDMLRWLVHMSHPRVGSLETWNAMRTPLTSHGYGLGLFMGEYRGLRILHHAGGVIGGSSQMLKVIDHDLDIILMSNRSGVIAPIDLAEQVIDACVTGLTPKFENTPAEKAITATFHSAATGAYVRLFAEGGRQSGELHGTGLPLLRDANGVLTSKSATTDARITPIFEAGQLVAVDLTEYGVTERLPRQQAPGDGGKAMLSGRYDCPTASATGVVTVAEDGGVRLAMRGAWGGVDYRLKPVGPGLWSCSTGNPLLPLGGVIEVDDQGFRFSSTRTRRLRFRRALSDRVTTTGITTTRASEVETAE